MNAFIVYDKHNYNYIPFRSRIYTVKINNEYYSIYVLFKIIIVVYTRIYKYTYLYKHLK